MKEWRNSDRYGIDATTTNLCTKHKTQCILLMSKFANNALLVGLGFGLENKERSKGDQRHY